MSGAPQQKEKDENNKKNKRLMILLSVNAAAILAASIIIVIAILCSNPGPEKLSERTDIIEGEVSQVALIDSVSNSDVEVPEPALGNDDYIVAASHEFDGTAVPNGELWNEKSITIYATSDIDICLGGGLRNLGPMYWQTSDPSVIPGFYDNARTWLGYSDNSCKYPMVSSAGTTTITAGTYDGSRRDSLVINVIMPPVEHWKHEVLTLVNKIRTKNNLSQLAWGSTCEEAANIRAKEAKEAYDHTRPDGSSWSTACPVPESGGVSGENLAAGNAAVSPATVVAFWMSSESHRKNILNPEYTNLAVGFVFDPNSTYKTYWSQIFSTY